MWWVIGFKPLGGVWTFKVIQGSQAQAQAQQHLAVNGTLEGPFPSKAAAQSAVAKEGKNPNPVKNLIGNPLHGIEAIGNFFNKLGQAATWKRVAEVILGAALVIIGIAKLAAGTPAGKAAAGIATKAALA
jgi:hypothetical protein